MTYRELCARLHEAGVPDPERDAAILMEEALGLSSAGLMARRNEYFDDPRLNEWARRRASREPLQYILGRWSFMGLDFSVCPDCLIPRADTELLCEEALRSLPRGGVFADLCTGSGCIALSILKLRGDCRALAVDLSPEALAVAKKNAKELGVADRVTFLLHDVTEPLPGDESFDLIVSNPPYVPTEDTKALEPELYHEPMLALDGGGDGMSVIRPMLTHVPTRLRPGGKLLIEFGYQSGGLVADLAHEATIAGRLARYEIRKDLSGNDRLLVAEA
ncbi:MAG: peptide chain release factor N(5)-glutamine methyltransferase [Clostridia bacterium]|nr:peptide chain release factor N(5)-glutamine methyltransferase [Clostridia bacterium]